MADSRTLTQRVLPPAGLPRQLALQSAVVAVGWGVYLTGSVVFFKLYVGLSAVQIGVGLSIAGFVGVAVSMPLGHLADRIGGKLTWVIGAAVGVVAFLAYPLVGSFWPFVLVLALQTISQGMTDAGRTVYTAAAVPREIRVRTMAFVRSYLNAGFTIGAGVGAAAIALNSRPGLLILVLANAVGIAISAFFVARMPTIHATAAGITSTGTDTTPTGTASTTATGTPVSDVAAPSLSAEDVQGLDVPAPDIPGLDPVPPRDGVTAHDDTPPRETTQRDATEDAGDASAPSRPGPPRPWGVLRDHAFMALTAVFAVMYLNEVLFGQIMPLWAITSTDAPRPVLGALFALNTIMAVLLQVPATKNAVSTSGAARLFRLAALATAVACPVFAFSGMTSGWATVAVLALGVVLLTGTELWSSAAQWFFVTEVPPPEQRGAYIGAANTVTGISKMLGPAGLTFLAVRTGGWGWWVIAALFAASAVAVRPVVSWIGRTSRNGTTPARREPAGKTT